MVKVQRKPSGSTNVGGAASSRPNTVGSTHSRPVKIRTRANIFSDYGPDPTSRENFHHAPVHKESATWVIKKQDALKYDTENLDKFDDPKNKDAILAHKNEGFETSRVKMRSQAADKFFKLAKSRYGGAEDLFRAVSQREEMKERGERD